MMEKEKKKGIVGLVILVLVIAALSYVVLVHPYQNLEENSGYFYTIGIKEAYDLINKSEKKEINLTVVDCRELDPYGCTICTFKRGHLPHAILLSDPKKLFNSTCDILVYSKNGTVGEEFCKELVGHVKGRIYNLEGGWEAWENYNRTYGWPPIEKE